MHFIEQHINDFLDKAATGEAPFDESLMGQCLEDVRAMFAKSFHTAPEKEFRLRMSNIGKPLRALMLERKYGRTKAEPSFILKMLTGHFQEAVLTYIVRSAGLQLNTNTRTSIDVDGTVIEGELDWHVLHDDKVYDVKTASAFSYNHKFATYYTLIEKDSFGYEDQLIGYSLGLGKEAGGWLVYHKETGEFKVVPYPHSIAKVKEGFYSRIRAKIKAIEENKMPECTGLTKELFYKKPTGNTIIGDECRFCPYKQLCHPTAKCGPSKVSQARNKPEVWYV